MSWAKQQIAKSGLRAGKTNTEGACSQIRDSTTQVLLFTAPSVSGSSAELCFTRMSVSGNMVVKGHIHDCWNNVGPSHNTQDLPAFRLVVFQQLICLFHRSLTTFWPPSLPQ